MGLMKDEISFTFETNDCKLCGNLHQSPVLSCLAKATPNFT